MSKLDELIQEYCPDGVEYKTFEQVVNYQQPTKYIVKNTDYNDNFQIPVLTAGQTFILGYTNERNGIYNASKENPVVIFDDFTAAFKWVDFPFKIKSSAIKILTANESYVMLRYVYHVMGKIAFYSDEHKRLWIGQYSKFKLPVPPLEVQREIVRVLDNFTLLTAELTAELTARKKQYEYYRDELLTFDVLPGGINGTEWKTLEESCYMKAGKSISSRLISVEQTITHPIKCYGGNGIRGFVKDANEYGSYPIIGRQGALCGNVNFTDGAFYATEHAIVVKSKGEYNSRFLYYLLINMNLNQYKSAGAQPGLSVARLNKLLAPVPPLETQKRIVHVLDNFEKICSDLNIGLPAEIAVRQKQYEYYRDALLTFAAKGDIIVNRTEQNRTEQNRTEQNRTEQNTSMS